MWRGALQPARLEAILRENKHTSFRIAFAQLVGIDFDLANRLMEAKDIDAVAMLCRSADFDKSLFVALCMMLLGGAGGVKKAEHYGQLYVRVPVSAAQRAVRFWKIRAGIR